VRDVALGAVFAAGVITSLGFSWVLVVHLERVGARLGFSEALLGMLAALAGDAPEITAAATAIANHDPHIGAGVVLGSNVFNLAALLGLSAVIAVRIRLHRRVIELSGAVALLTAVICLAVVLGTIAALVGLALELAVMVPYVALLARGHDGLSGLRAPAAWRSWLVAAVSEEEAELEVALHPRRARGRDELVAVVAAVVVVVASIAMERSASELGSRHAVPQIVTGGLVLAAVTSLPNAVAAVYLAMRARGTAVLSTALNSNSLNVLAGLLIPAAIIGLGPPSGQTTFVALSYLALTSAALIIAYVDRGLRRSTGIVVIAAYAAFALVLVLGGS
jgi:cation:H+ antiporter